MPVFSRERWFKDERAAGRGIWFDLMPSLLFISYFFFRFSFTIHPSFISLEPELVAESEISERKKGKASTPYFLLILPPLRQNGSRITPSESKPHLSDLNKHPNAFLIRFSFAQLTMPSSKSPCVNIKCFNRILWDTS